MAAAPGGSEQEVSVRNLAILYLIFTILAVVCAIFFGVPWFLHMVDVAGEFWGTW